MWELLKRDSPFSSLWLQTLPDRTYQECCLRNVKVQSLGVTLTQPVDFSRAKKERAFYSGLEATVILFSARANASSVRG